jgi:hypothetical protein
MIPTGTLVLAALDHRMFEFQLAHESQARGEAVREQEHEPMKVEQRGSLRRRRVTVFDGLVQMHFHIAGNGASPAVASLPIGSGRTGQQRQHGHGDFGGVPDESGACHDCLGKMP